MVTEVDVDLADGRTLHVYDTRGGGPDALASCAADIASIADALGLGRFAVLGHSGGGPHALACAALLPGRVIAALEGDWSWVARVAAQDMEQGIEGYAEDTLAFVRPWGFQPGAIGVPVLIMHGADDKMVPAAFAGNSAGHPAGRTRPATT